jgi:transcriptional regulator with XRE-family HTH domain
MSANAKLSPRSVTVAMAKQQTDAPFHEAFAKLKDERGLSYRDLRAMTSAAGTDGRGLSASHLSRLSNGLDPPSAATIALIAKALDLPPRYFAEYRLAEARALLDERAPDGLRSALRHLRRFEASTGAPRATASPTRRSRRRAS